VRDPQRQYVAFILIVFALWAVATFVLAFG